MNNHKDFIPIELQGTKGRLAAYYIEGTEPTVVYIHGFRSHGLGTKATALANCVSAAGHAYASFDQHGSGKSDGLFQDFTISGGLTDLETLLTYLAPAPVVLVGSSLGGVLAVAAAPSLGSRLKGLLLIAPAFGLLSHYFDAMPAATRDAWARTGSTTLRDEYAEGNYTLGYRFYEDAQQYRQPRCMNFACPVVVVHGEKDEVLPVEDSLAFAGSIQAPRIGMFVVPQADHRLIQALPLMCTQIEALCQDRDGRTDDPRAIHA